MKQPSRPEQETVSERRTSQRAKRCEARRHAFGCEMGPDARVKRAGAAVRHIYDRICIVREARVSRGAAAREFQRDRREMWGQAHDASDM